MSKVHFFTFWVVALFLACNEEKPPSGDDSVEQIRRILAQQPTAAAAETDSLELTQIVFEEIQFDFGEAMTGDAVSHVFRFKNTGDKPLLLKKVYTSCGCTMPEFPTEPILPGGSGEVVGRLNTTGREGKQFSQIFVTSNTQPAETTLVLTGFLKSKN